MKRKIAFLLLFGPPLCYAQTPQNQDPAIPPTHNHDGMNDRGEKGMGFSQTETTHHFLLTPTGGMIQVEANNPKDSSNRDNIKMHLRHIASSFKNGNFDIPMFVHDQEPPGVSVMKSRAEHINYSVEQTANGGRVVIRTTDKDAIEAIHQFLRFQIQEHKTGDQTTL